MSAALNKIHVTNSTGLSLNERFTAITSQPKVLPNIGSTHRSRSRSRSRSVQRSAPVVKRERVTSRANQRLLAQLQRKHKLQAALKLKRRSMRTVGGGAFNGNGSNRQIQRGTVKAFRVGANGKPIRTNSFARVATMKADNEQANQHNAPLRRTNSSGNLANRLGPRRPTAGGAAQRVARRLERQRGRSTENGRLAGRGRSAGGPNNRGRSRSRSRTRVQPENIRVRTRSRSRLRNLNNHVNNRSRSRNRNRNDNANNNVRARRGRSRSRSRGRVGIINRSALPIKARLGVRPGQNNRQRIASLTRRGVKSGRVQKRRNSTNINVNAIKAPINDNNRRGRQRSRSVPRNDKNGSVRSRSRSRTRKGQVGQKKQSRVEQQQQQQRQQRNNRAPRGRIQQRRGNNGKVQTQQRRGRSRSRTRRGSNGGSRNQGNKSTPAKPVVNKDDLDKELDQYMATTKTENEMDYLLKN